MLLRVKDSLIFINEWLDRYKDIADEIVALDNGSTDGTLEILRTNPKVVQVLQTEGYNEGRDKNMLYDAARKRNPDWLLWLDADEILEPQVTRKDFDKMMNSKIVDRFAFRRFHFIDRGHFAGSAYWLKYSSGPDRLLWREKPSGYFKNVILDSPNVKGIGGLKAYTNIRLKHLGYINKALVDKKADTYRQIDPNNAVIQTMYIHDQKKVRWVDDRKSLQVKLLNMRLNMLLYKDFIAKGFNKVFGAIAAVGKKLMPAREQAIQETVNA